MLIIYAQNPYYLYISRFMSGFSGSANYVILPVFVAEIADNKLVEDTEKKQQPGTDKLTFMTVFSWLLFFLSVFTSDAVHKKFNFKIFTNKQSSWYPRISVHIVR